MNKFEQAIEQAKQLASLLKEIHDSNEIPSIALNKALADLSWQISRTFVDVEWFEKKLGVRNDS